MDDNISRIRKLLGINQLTDDEIRKELRRFQSIGGKIIEEEKRVSILFDREKQKKLQENLKSLNEAKKKKKRNTGNEYIDVFKTIDIVKQEVIPILPKMDRDKKGLSYYINNLKIDFFAVKNKTNIKKGIDLFKSFLSILSNSISEYINNDFIDTIHIDLLKTLADISTFSKELIKIDKSKITEDLKTMYAYKIMKTLSLIDVDAASSYLSILEKKGGRPYKYYMLAPILKYLYIPITLLEDIYKNNEIFNSLKHLTELFPKKISIINALREMLHSYFKVYKKIMYPILLKDIGGTFYNIDFEPLEFKNKQLEYFDLTSDDLIEINYKEYEKKFNILQTKKKTKNKSKSKENEIDIISDYNKLPNEFDEIIDTLSQFFPPKYIELKRKKPSNDLFDKPKSIMFDIGKLANFSDIFRYFHSSAENSSYSIDDRFLYFSRFHPMSQIAVFSFMIIDLFSGLININYNDNAKIFYNNEDYHPSNYFKKILEDINIVYNDSVNKVGNLIRDISLSYSNNPDYWLSKSFEIYLDEITIYMKKNYLPNIQFNKTILGEDINSPKFNHLEVKSSLLHDPFFKSIEKLKKGIHEIYNSIDRRGNISEEYISSKELSSHFKLGTTNNPYSLFNSGFISIFVKTEYEKTKIITKDERTVFNYILFVKKIIDLLDYIINNSDSYILNYAHPTILRNQKNLLLRVIDENEKSLIFEARSIDISTIIDQSFQDRNSLLKENIKLKKEINKNQIHSPSGVFTKKYFTEQFPIKVEQAKKNNEQLSLIIMDIDNFKILNDTAGHKFGDFVLECIGKMLKEILRKDDIVAESINDIKDDSIDKFASSFGGDEFVLILPRTDIENAKKIAIRILEDLNDKITPEINFEYKRSLDESLKNLEIDKNIYNELIKKSFISSASIGVASLNKSFTKDKLFELADTGVYASKMNNKNSISIYSTVEKSNAVKDGFKVYKKVDNKWQVSEVSLENIKLWQGKNMQKS